MEVDYGITAGLYWSIILSRCDWQVLTHRRPCWYTQEIRKWKQIRKMPQDSFYPWQIRWPRSMPQHSHVNRIAFTHLSEAAQQSQKKPHKLCFPAALQLWWFGSVCLACGLNCCVICLLLKMLTYKLSYLLSRKQEACYIVKICGEPSVAALFWR